MPKHMTTLTIASDDLHWIAQALRQFAGGHCKANNLPYAAKRLSALADSMGETSRRFSHGYCAHMDCVEAIEKAGGLEPYTIARLQ